MDNQIVPSPRSHSWIPDSHDFTEWKCEFCGFHIEAFGPPCESLNVVYILEGSDEEHTITCEEIENGAITVFQIHDA